MKIVTIKTHKITAKDNNLFKILDKYLKTIKEKSILAVTSKIVAICEGNLIKISQIDKQEIIKKEADYYLPSPNQYGFLLTIKNGILMPSAGIDESNGNGYYILHPTNPQETANKIRKYLINRFKIRKVGVIITDSRTLPLRWGTTGVALAHSGFSALNNYIGKEDIFGRKLKATKVNVIDGLAAAAVLLMGESSEQTPLALISDIPFVQFQKRNPTKKEITNLTISLKNDIYSQLLTAVSWQKVKTLKNNKQRVINSLINS